MRFEDESMVADTFLAISDLIIDDKYKPVTPVPDDLNFSGTVRGFYNPVLKIDTVIEDPMISTNSITYDFTSLIANGIPIRELGLISFNLWIPTVTGTELSSTFALKTGETDSYTI